MLLARRNMGMLPRRKSPHHHRRHRRKFRFVFQILKKKMYVREEGNLYKQNGERRSRVDIRRRRMVQTYINRVTLPILPSTPPLKKKPNHAPGQCRVSCSRRPRRPPRPQPESSIHPSIDSLIRPPRSSLSRLNSYVFIISPPVSDRMNYSCMPELSP